MVHLLKMGGVGKALVLLAAFLAGVCWSADRRPEFVDAILQAVHQARRFVDAPAAFSEERRNALKHTFESLAEDRQQLEHFVEYAYGPGLLYLDAFRADLAYLHQSLEDYQVRGDIQGRLRAIGFAPFVFVLSDISSADIVGHAQQGIEELKAITHETLSAQRSFEQASERAEKWLWRAHAALILGLSSLGINQFWHVLGLDTMTPREFVTFLGGVWAATAGSYWLFWEHFRWIEPFRKWAARSTYKKLSDAWSALIQAKPNLTVSTVAAAAAQKPVSTASRNGALADAALRALLQSPEPRAKDALFELFLRALEAGQNVRAMRILQNLEKGTSYSKHARLGKLVAKVFAARERMEMKFLKKQFVWASLRLSLLGLGLWSAMEAVHWFAPADIAHWRAVPGAVLGAAGAKRLFQFIWRPQRAPFVEVATQEEEATLRAAFREILEVEPTGEVLSRLAAYDSGASVHRRTTYIAADTLAREPSGLATRALLRIVRAELKNAGSRVAYLLDSTYRSQTTCLNHLLALVQRTAAHLR